MKEKEILEGNKSIEKFVMGKDWVEAEFQSRGIENKNYHNTWDYLVPIGNKILQLVNTDVEIQRKLKDDGSFIAMRCAKTMFAVSNVSGQLEINSVFLKVCDFIKWYNKNKN